MDYINLKKVAKPVIKMSLIYTTVWLETQEDFIHAIHQEIPQTLRASILENGCKYKANF